MIHSSVKIGKYCSIDEDVEIGEGTTIKDYVEIRKGTVIGKYCYIDSRVSFSGECKIGDNVTLRYGTIIARGCDIGDKCFLAPGVMTNNLDEGINNIGGAKLGKRVFVGSHTVLHHGIEICDDVKIGSCSFVNKSLTKKGTYYGNPVK